MLNLLDLVQRIKQMKEGQLNALEDLLFLSEDNHEYWQDFLDATVFLLDWVVQENDQEKKMLFFLLFLRQFSPRKTALLADYSIGTRLLI